MCGIAGIIPLRSGAPTSPDTLKRMVAALRHRGPDGVGYYEGDGALLGHARLSIIDLQSGDQPIHNEDKSVWITFNGEIFNYVELRKDLERRGHQFYTESDTEVIVHLYEEFGDDFVQQLNGQFAFAVWDERSQRLLLVRDRVGMMPLFYSTTAGKCYFASEVKSLFASREVPASADPAGLDQVFTLWSPLAPKTVFEGVQQVCPGEMIIISDGQITSRKYWQWTFPSQDKLVNGPVDEVSEEVHDLLSDATRLRLRADVPVGAYLSGGLDSSAIAALVRESGISDLHTFSIGFEEQLLDETEHQQTMAKWLGTKHQSLRCSSKQFAGEFRDCISSTEVPILRIAPIPMRLLSQLVCDAGYKVVLTGEGADEVFGGYDIFKEAKIRAFWAREPESNSRPRLLSRLYPYMRKDKRTSDSYLQAFYGRDLKQKDTLTFSHLPRWHVTSQIKLFYSDSMRARPDIDATVGLNAAAPSNWRSWHPFNRAEYVEARTLLPGYLLSSQGDRMLMANSVEGRFPYLDHRVIEFAQKLHPKLKMRALNEKFVLKRAMSSQLPNSILQRSKQPYRAPDAQLLLNSDDGDFAELLSEASISAAGYFDAKRVSRLIDKARRSRHMSERDSMAITGILATQAWHAQFIAKQW